MPASSQTAASERRNERVLTHEPPKLKTTLKTPPKQATNPLQFVKVGPCSLYRTAQEQLQKVQEVKKIKQEVRDDPEDWQSNLDNWKSSRRKRQEHIIERVVEVKKLELEEHDRLRRKNKTFSEMMEERGNRGRKLSISLAMYNDEDANDLSDLGIGTSSGKSSVSGDTHDDTHSVLSDRDSEIEKSHSDVDNTIDVASSTTSSIATLTTTAATIATTSVTATIASVATATTSADTSTAIESTITPMTTTATTTVPVTTTSTARKMFGGGFHGNLNHNQEYDSGTTATTSSPEPEEYTYEGAIRGYVSRVSQNIPRRSLTGIDSKLDTAKSSLNGSKTNLNDDSSKSPLSLVKVDILKRREVFEKASQKSSDSKANNRLSGDFTGTKSIKERLSSLERQKYETENGDKATNKTLNRLSGDMSSIRERLTHLEKQASERESKSSVHRKLSTEDLETVRPVRERLSTLEKYSSSDESSVPTTTNESRSHNGEFTARTIKDRLSALDVARSKDAMEKRGPAHVGKHPLCFRDQENRVDTSTPSERSSSPDSEYRVPRAVFHRSLDSLDADASSGPDTFERVQSLEELDYGRQYPASSSSAELLNDTDREDSGIHTADVSCSVSQADEPIDEEIVQHTSGTIVERREVEERIKTMSVIQEDALASGTIVEAPNDTATTRSQFTSHREAVAVNKERIVIEKADQEEEVATTAANRPVVPAVEHKQQETTETSTNVVKKKCDVDIDMHDAPNAMVATPTADHPLERPTNLSLAKQEVSLVDALNTPNLTSPISKQFLPLTLSNDEEIIADQPFLLSPPTSVEPPKEKPPPPPVDVSDDDNPPPEPLKRLNSTRRIKKELRTRRSDFLGIEGQVNDEDFEPELTLTKPPDMAAILAEERRIEQLHRRSYDTDSNYEQDSSHERDSGVELGHVEDWAKQPVSPDMSQHSRQSSEPFGASVTSSEEDEITKKEREIIEVLEKEEQWRYGDNREYNSDLGEKLAHKLRELEEEKMQLEREAILRCNEDAFRKRDDARKQEDASSHEQSQQQHDETAKQREIQMRTTEKEAKYIGDKRKDEELETQSGQLRMQNEIEEKERRVADACRKEEMRIRTMESQIREQESKALVGAGLSSNEDEFPSGEVLRVERELLQLEQEELKRQRNNLAYREQKQLRLAEQLQEQWKSLQDVAQNSIKTTQQYKYHTPAVNYRSSMPNLQFQDAPRRRPPPPPIPLTKPRMLDQRQRDVTIRNSRIPSADSIPQQVDASIRESASTTTLGNHTGQQMSRQTLQALSAVPRPRIVQGDQWVQRRKSDVPRGANDVNYQHWLIQEAEQRRINERNQRSPARKSQPHVTGTSVPYNAPIRTDNKPLPDSIIQTLTQRVQSKTQEKPLLTRRRPEQVHNQEHLTVQHQSPQYTLQSQKTQHTPIANNSGNQEKMLSVSGKKKCSHCGEELGRGAAMIIESLRLFYHMECFKCCVCHVRLGDGLMGTDVRVRNHKLHCHNCYSSDDGVKFSCV
ncbi:PREDICTED: calponin homology domain-containing protein DDB_G0272472 isoform X4 [Trachymyrmex cornetzi]|uniref:calponin homology domain-containing protein DDB_G0272472 isoform X4 n=1 Tax=Trachymyrmex cornetzi TaxID=471704 RepID=UPI00084F31B5|nr:PREDICTED: calponin homology domain-containing protein DDB_G0272472 isoform X4 [Trachymyrmex cornetzi]